MNPSSSERSASSTGSGSPEKRPKEQAPSNTTKAVEGKAAGEAESDSDAQAEEVEEEKEEEDEEEDPEEEEKEGEEQSDKEANDKEAKDPDDSSEDSSQEVQAAKEETRVRLVPAGRARSRSSGDKKDGRRSKSDKKDRSASKRKRRSSSSRSRKRKSPKRASRVGPILSKRRSRSRSARNNKDRNKRSRSRKKDRSASKRKRRSSSSRSRKRKSPKRASRVGPIPSKRRSRSRSARNNKDRMRRSKSRKKARSSSRRRRRSSSSKGRKRRSTSKARAATNKAIIVGDGQAKAPRLATAPEVKKEGDSKPTGQTPALSAAEELRQALFGNAKPAQPAPKPAPAPKISFGLPKKPQVMDWRRRSTAETKPLQQNTGMVAVPGSEFAFRAHAGELAAAVAAAQALHNPRNREISRKIATLLEQCPPMSDDALTALRALPSDQVVQVLQTLASRRGEITDPSVWVNHVVSRLAVAAFNTAQGVPLPSTMVTEMLNRHLPKLATAAKSLLLQIPEVEAIKIIQDHLTYRGDASDSIFQAATTHLQQGIAAASAASACSAVYPMTMDAFSMGCGMMPMAMPGCFGAMMPGQMAPMAGCGMMGCAWGGAMPCATNGTTEVATEAAGTAAPEAAATAPAAAAPALEDTDAPAEEAAAFTQDAADADVSAEDEDNLPQQEFVSSLAGVAPLKQEQPGDGC